MTRAISCDDVRELLPEHLLGTLPDPEDAAVRSHLRGCGACRREMALLGEGLATFARAAHQADPPDELRDRVMAALAEERTEAAPPQRVAHRPRRWLALAASIAIAAGAVAWGATTSVRASHDHDQAVAYRQFLEALGGREVRVAELVGSGSRPVEGSAIMYDSEVGQSWVLVLLRSPGATGAIHVVLRSPTGRISMRPTEFNSEGSTDVWLVTSADISKYDHVAVYDAGGRQLATGRVHQG
ncbi:MAG: zf-HC2 domain-containing protein [Actinomycetota bacterium]